MFSTKIAGNGMEGKQVGVKISDGKVTAEHEVPTARPELRVWKR